MAGLLDMAMKGVKPSPTIFGRRLLPRLLGGAIASADEDDDVFDDTDPEDKP
jgi:hypothetical protein